MKNRHKITPDIRKILTNTATSLPKMQKVGPTGLPAFRVLDKCVMGRDLPDDAPIEGGGKPSPNKLYHSKIKEPLYLNHSVNLNEIFMKDGMAGVKAYTQFIMEEYAKKATPEVKSIEPEPVLNPTEY